MLVSFQYVYYGKESVKIDYLLIAHVSKIEGHSQTQRLAKI